MNKINAILTQTVEQLERMNEALAAGEKASNSKLQASGNLQASRAGVAACGLMIP